MDRSALDTYLNFNDSLDFEFRNGFVWGSNNCFVLEMVKFSKLKMNNESIYYLWSSEEKSLVEYPEFGKLLRDNGRMVSVSPSGDLALFVRQGDKEHRITVWSIDDHAVVLSMRTERIHGSINVGNAFETFSWNENCQLLLYSAEELHVDASTWTDSFAYHSSWSSQADIRHSSLYVLDIRKQSIQHLPLTEPYSLGPACWVDEEGDHISIIGWKENPVRESIIMPTCLPSDLFLYSISADSLRSIATPIFPQHLRFSKSTQTLAVFGAKRGMLSHNSAMSLVLLSFPSLTLTLCCNEVESPEDGMFPGIYLSTLPSQPFSPDGQYPQHRTAYLYCSSIWNSYRYTLQIDLHHHSISPVSLVSPGMEQLQPEVSYLSESRTMSSEVLTVSKGHLLIKANPFHSPVVQLINPSTAVGITAPLTQTVFPYHYFIGKTVTHAPFILYSAQSPPSSSKLLVLVHGGPHLLFTASYTKDVLFYLSQGFAVLVPHYHGSIGFGAAYQHALNGHIGDIEVEDVASAIQNVLENTQIDPTQVYYMGSSYGGFIGLHLLEKHPTLIRKAILRNPVCDTLTMLTSSDMTIWMLVLAGCLESRENKNPDVWNCSYVYTSKDILQVNEKNPISYIKEIQTPICFILGKEDQRVITKQALEAYRILKNSNRSVELYLIPDDHFLLSPVSNQFTAAKVVEYFCWSVCFSQQAKRTSSTGNPSSP